MVLHLNTINLYEIVDCCKLLMFDISLLTPGGMPELSVNDVNIITRLSPGAEGNVHQILILEPSTTARRIGMRGREQRKS